MNPNGTAAIASNSQLDVREKGLQCAYDSSGIFKYYRATTPA